MIQGGKNAMPSLIQSSSLVVNNKQIKIWCVVFSVSDIQRLSSFSSPIFSEINEHKSSNMFPPSTDFLTTNPKHFTDILSALLAKKSS